MDKKAKFEVNNKIGFEAIELHSYKLDHLGEHSAVIAARFQV